ncbi:hypothetical protein B296_00034851 [Ensete ventricosum]|uniref:Methyltransferase type 11 domain-containing protein n=1 Tax=Ensete ventricosum TaxID=4639 RepID=A0A426X2Q4_ENSVE|nr:hypothetical protein B296_00034851 [Ensete ventricosum]
MVTVRLPPPLPKIAAVSSSHSHRSRTAGKIKRLVLTSEGRTKLNIGPDRDFYALPRFVNHVDAAFISALTGLYRERLAPGWAVLDLMSSWVSHLPQEVAYERVVGHGLNAQELARNPRLDYFFVKDLNRDQELQFEDCSFHAVVIAVSVQYLQWPEKNCDNLYVNHLLQVFAEVFRVLKPGGVFIVSFSDRLFYEKAISAWRDGSDYSRVQLVVQYFQSVDGFTQPEIVKNVPPKADASLLSGILRLIGLYRIDPFYAVIACRNFKPVYEEAQ